MKVCGGAEVGGEQDDTAEGEEDTGGLLDGRVSPSPPPAANQRYMLVRVPTATKSPCLSARVMGESWPGTAQPRRVSGGEEVPPEKPGGRGNPWPRPALGGRGK